MLVAFKQDAATDVYQLGPVELMDGTVPRRVHLQWVRNCLRDGIVPDELDRALGDAYCESLLDVAENRADAGLSNRTYAKAFGGPADGTPAELRRWLSGPTDIFNTDAGGSEEIIALLEDTSPAYRALREFLRANDAIWRDPDTGNEIGRIELQSSISGWSWLEASTSVAVTCLQWSFDLVNARVRVEVREQ